MGELAADLPRAVEAEELALGVLGFDDSVGDERESLAVAVGRGVPMLAIVTGPEGSNRAQQQVTKPPRNCPASPSFKLARIAPGDEVRWSRNIPIVTGTSMAALSPLPLTSPATTSKAPLASARVQ